MNKDILKEILLEQNESFAGKQHLIERDLVDKSYLTSQQVIIISGVRRCGKSSLLFLIKQEMKLNEKEYCYFNFDDERIIPDTSLLEDIFNLHIEIYGKEPVLFFDEIQNIPKWEKFINRKHENGIKIFVTGSNAKLLSSEISTSLTGRNKVIELFPFSFAEYLRYRKVEVNLNRLTAKQRALFKKDFNQFLHFGGFPLVIKEGDLELINGYFQDILYRDIIARYHISQVNEIKEIGIYFASNAGKLFSYSTLQSITGIKSLSSIKDYLGYYEQSYLFFYLKKFDFSIKKQIMNPKKVYSIDSAFINRLGFAFSQNKGRVLENIIFIELLRRGKEVYYFSGKNECDFIIKQGIVIVEAIQVVYEITEQNIERETKGLLEAMSVYKLSKGLIITQLTDTNLVFSKYQNITVINAWQWLLIKN